jgi:site-specific recombinase XerD
LFFLNVLSSTRKATLITAIPIALCQNTMCSAVNSHTTMAKTKATHHPYLRTLVMLSAQKPFVLYSLRHTMLTRLGEAGADTFAIQKIAGHSSILVSQRYVHPTPERLESAFAALEAYNTAQQEKLTAAAKVQ